MKRLFICATAFALTASASLGDTPAQSDRSGTYAEILKQVRKDSAEIEQKTALLQQRLRKMAAATAR